MKTAPNHLFLLRFLCTEWLLVRRGDLLLRFDLKVAAYQDITHIFPSTTGVNNSFKGHFRIALMFNSST